MMNRLGILILTVIAFTGVSAQQALLNKLGFYEDSLQMRIDSTLIADYYEELPELLLPLIESRDFTQRYIARRILTKYDDKQNILKTLKEHPVPAVFIYSVCGGYDMRNEIALKSRLDSLSYIDYLSSIRNGLNEIMPYTENNDPEIRERALKALNAYISEYGISKCTPDSIWALRTMKNIYTDFQISSILANYPLFVDSIAKADSVSCRESVMIVNAAFLTDNSDIIESAAETQYRQNRTLIELRLAILKENKPELYESLNIEERE